MFEAKCYDIDGNSIDGFTQWDIDQQMTIKLEGCGKDHISVSDKYFSIAPEVHFSNVKRNTALVVRSTVVDKSTIMVSVPNVLLTEPYPLLVYVYLTDNRDVSAQKTIVHVELPIRKRNEPDSYWYVENIERITAEMIKEEIEADTKKTRDEAIKAITDTKTEAINTVENTKSTAIRNIIDIKNNAEAFITAQKQDFVNTGNSIVSAAQKIKDDTKVIYDNTVNVANQTEQKIINDINRAIYERGVQFKTSDDGHGNITMTIVVPRA